MAISGEETSKAFYMEGWVRHDKTAEVEKTIAAVDRCLPTRLS